MHAISGAIAVKKGREVRRKRRMSQVRRMSRMSMADETPRPSVVSIEGGPFVEDEFKKPSEIKSESSMTTFHMGVVFILLGFLMIFSSLIPKNMVSQDWDKLLGVGIFFIFLGLIMIMINRILSNKEEEELSEYVKKRLARSKSSHRMSGHSYFDRDVAAHRMSRHGSHSESKKHQSHPNGDALEAKADGEQQKGAGEPILTIIREESDLSRSKSASMKKRGSISRRGSKCISSPRIKTKQASPERSRSPSPDVHTETPSEMQKLLPEAAAKVGSISRSNSKRRSKSKELNVLLP